MVPESAATPAAGKIRVVGDFAGGLPLAVVLGARLRDNGGWFWNPNAAAILTAARKMDAPVGAAEIKNRPGGRCFHPRSVKSSVLTSLAVKPIHPSSSAFGRNGRGSVFRSSGDSPYPETSPQRVGGYWPTFCFLVKDNG
jgi:hypothetical protein